MVASISACILSVCGVKRRIENLLKIGIIGAICASDNARHHNGELMFSSQLGEGRRGFGGPAHELDRVARVQPLIDQGHN